MVSKARPDSLVGEWRSGSPVHNGVCDGATITARQRQLLPLVCRGFSNKEMAADLYVGEDDIEYLVRELLGRTGSRNRTQLAAWAVEHNFGGSGIP